MGKAKDLLANINANMIAIASSLGALATEIDRLEALDKPAPAPTPVPAPVPAPTPTPTPVTGLSNIKTLMLPGGLVSLSWDGGAARLVRKSTGGDIANYFVDRSSSPYADDHVFTEGEQDAYLLWPLVSGKPDAARQATSGTFTYHAPQPAPAPTPAPTPSPAPGTLRLLPQLPDSVDVSGVLRGVHVCDHPDGSTDAYMTDPANSWMEYDRPDWTQIEKSPGNYDWTVLDNGYNGAKSRGRTYGLGVTMHQTYNDHSSYPAWYPWNNGGPVWNDSAYINAVLNFISTLGKWAQGKSYLEFVDMRFWGPYSEGNNFGSRNPDMTLANKQRIVDAWLVAFPATSPVILLSMTDDADSTDYAIQRAHDLKMPWKVGKRRDSYSNGDGPQPWGFNGYDETGRPQLTQDQWRYAPFVVENGGINFNQDWAKANLQTDQFHIACLKDQNHGHIYTSWAQPDKGRWDRDVRVSGYRLTVQSLMVSGKTLTLNWSNTGLTPLYRDYRVELVLLSGGLERVVSSSISLRTLMPGDKRAITEDLSGLPSGTHTLRLRAVDAAGVRKPLQFALQNRLPDGSYDLGSLNIS